MRSFLRPAVARAAPADGCDAKAAADGRKRLIEWQIEALARGGVREIVVNTAHLPNLFEDVLGDGQQYGVSLYYSREGESADGLPESLGGIIKALPHLGAAPFIVTSGDIVTDFAYRSLRGKRPAAARPARRASGSGREPAISSAR